MNSLIEKIVAWALALISKFGYAGIFLTMGLESAGIPIPSEVVVPFSGFLAAQGRFSLALVAAAATLANLTGSLIFYFIGLRGGRPVIDKYGKYFLIHKDEVVELETWTNKYGSKVAFFSRLLPGIRTFSSIVIGAGRLKLKKFFWFTLAGSLVWNLPLAYVGFAAGNKWGILQPYFRKFEAVIAAVIVIAVTLFIFKHIHRITRLNRHPQT